VQPSVHLPSPVPHIIGTNSLPTKDDVISIRNTIRESRADLSELRDEIVHMESDLEALKHREIELKAPLDAHVTVLSPIRQLPPEILSVIFVYCTPEKSSPPRRDCAPLLTAHICALWRTVSLETGILWSTFRLDLHPQRVQLQTAWVTAWLARSADCPLAITLRASTISHQLALDAVVHHARRWRFMSVHLPVNLIESLRPTQDHFPILDRLNVSFVDEASDDSKLDIFALAPALTSVKLTKTPTNLSLPWIQLTHCTLSLCAKICLQIISRTPNLVYCSLEDCGLEEESILLPVTSDLTILCINQVHEDADMAMGIIFQHLTLPRIHTLIIDVFDETPWSHNQIISFLSRSSCAIQRLVLRSAVAPYTEIIDFLHHLPTLIELEIGWVDDRIGDSASLVQDDFLDQLSMPVQGTHRSVLLPSLQILKIWGCRHFQDAKLANVIESRWCPSSQTCPLHFIGLKYQRKWDEQAMSRIQLLRDAGLGLSVEKLDYKVQQAIEEDVEWPLGFTGVCSNQ